MNNSNVPLADVKEDQTKNASNPQIPEVNATREELIESFSLNTNEYLKCKWTRFLENTPQDVVVIRSYNEYKRRKSPVRRMILSGEPYSRSGHLIPIPQETSRRK